MKLAALGLGGYLASLFGVTYIYRLMLRRKYRGTGYAPARKG